MRSKQMGILKAINALIRDGRAADKAAWRVKNLRRFPSGGLAAFERELMRVRTEGEGRAKARGVRLGRIPKLTAHQQQEARRRRETGEALTDIARSYNVSRSTISRLAHREAAI